MNSYAPLRNLSKTDLREAVANELARRDFTAFKRRLYKRYQHAPHLALIDTALMDAVRYVETMGAEGHGFQMISVPPRHGKTMTVSRLFPPYVIGRYPDWRIILASYGATLAQKNSRAARNIIASPSYQAVFPGIQLAADSKSVDAWDIAGYEGGLDAMGVGGGVTGKGGQIIIIDDPVKSREEAESETYREKTWDWYTDDLYTRREPGGAIILIMTRWHQDDIAGRLLKNEADKWRTINLPAIDEQGRALWPERYPLTVLHDIERTLGPYSWSALYQQRPVPAEGGIFKRAWFEPRVSQPPEIVRAVRYWDLAMSEKTTADYTAGVKMGYGADGHVYVLDVARGQIEWGDVVGFMADTMLRDGPHVPQGVEEKGYMSRAVQELNLDGRLRGFQVWGYPVDKDKVTRALPFAAKCAAGVVHVVNAHWADAWLDEVCSFPNAAHDDQVDAASGAWIMLGEADTMGGIEHAESVAFSASLY